MPSVAPRISYLHLGLKKGILEPEFHTLSSITIHRLATAEEPACSAHIVSGCFRGVLCVMTGFSTTPVHRYQLIRCSHPERSFVIFVYRRRRIDSEKKLCRRHFRLVCSLINSCTFWLTFCSFIGLLFMGLRSLSCLEPVLCLCFCGNKSLLYSSVLVLCLTTWILRNVP